jgi:hypothetical protein
MPSVLIRDFSMKLTGNRDQAWHGPVACASVVLRKAEIHPQKRITNLDSHA